jgi:N-acetylglucosaminyldiphosphoundecaprenol N-acetyl-beta-D-mannosaminyltransferase
VGVESFFVGDVADAADAVVRRVGSGMGGYACLANVHVLVTADRESDVQEALDGAWAVFPDGWPVAWLQRRLGAKGAVRVAGPDLMPAVLDRGRETNLTHFLFGSTDAVLDRLESALTSRFPGIRVVGRHAPGFVDADPSEAEAAIQQIASARPHVVWCALGAPKQERWMHCNADALAPAVLVGVGAAFDFLSETKRRAPKLMRRLGLEWLHRLVTEPLRLGPRYLLTNTKFVFLAAPRALMAGRRQ